MKATRKVLSVLPRLLRLRRKTPAPNTAQTTPQVPLIFSADETRQGDYRYSIVSAVYNAEQYLDDFIASIVGQTLDFAQQLEIVLVDDGSTDNSLQRLREFESAYPSNIKVFSKTNGGQASAKNLGLQYATGQWISFIDPDDFVDADYFEEVDKLASTYPSVQFISTRLVFYHEAEDRFDDSHPLRYRFSHGNRVVSLDALRTDIPGSSTTALFRKDSIDRLSLRFDERIRPNFEDGHFANSYLIGLKNPDIAFCASARYNYRKRSQKTSTLDTSWQQPSRFGDVLEHGLLQLVTRAREIYGEVPLFLQHVLLYELFWYFKRIVGNQGSIQFLTEAQKERFCSLVRELMLAISPTAIQHFHLAGFSHRDLVGMLKLSSDCSPTSLRVDVIGFSRQERRLKLRYHHTSEEDFEILVDGVEVPKLYPKTQSVDFVGQPFVQATTFWVDAKNPDGCVSIQSKRGPSALFLRGSPRFEGLLIRQLATSLSPPPVREARTPLWVRRIRNLVRKPEVREEFGDCWVLMDRDTEAEDNAERLYQYLRDEHPEEKIFFVVAKESPHYQRLVDEGFNILAFGSRRHKLALLLAKHYVSSQADHYVLNVLPRKWFGDLINYRFTFLQHGVIKDNLSAWLNPKPIDCFITSTKPEYDSIVEDGSPYVFSTREVVLTGLARHDTLLEGRGLRERIVLVMPTWRKSLAARPVADTAAHAFNPEFLNSEYARSWGSFLRSEGLRYLAEDYGYRIQFCPHINLSPYLHAFRVPPYIETIGHDDGRSIQELFQKASMMITDFSSVAFEMAVLERAVVYFHFDFEAALAGSHTSVHGYFDYTRDGFGPRCYTEEELLDSVEDLLARDCVPEEPYASRMRETFPFRDQRNRQRIYEAMRQMDARDAEPHEGGQL